LVHRQVVERGFTIGLSGDSIAFQLTARGHVALSGARDVAFEFSRPRIVRVRGDSGALFLVGGAPKEARMRFPEIVATGLELSSEDEYARRLGRSERRLSSVVTGTVRHGLEGDGSPGLSLADGVAFASSTGRVRLELADSAVRLRFRGRVSGMMTIEGRSLMPSRLEWMRVYERRNLLLGTLLSAVGALTLLLRRLGMLGTA